jgi:hypothetical protein
MGNPAPARKLPSVWIAAVLLLGLLLLLAWSGRPAAAASLVAKDGRIHACYKAKGKGKGALRVVRSAKVRCPRGWKKTAWSASGIPGAGGENGAAGGAGEPGSAGATGGNGANGAAATSAKVESLEAKVTELLSKVQSLESILSGITNTQLKEAIAKVPVVASLCGEAKALNEQSNGLGSALSGLSAVVDTLTVLALPTVPAALPAFECP